MYYNYNAAADSIRRGRVRKEISTAQELIQLAKAVNDGRAMRANLLSLQRIIDLGGSVENQWMPIGNGTTFIGMFDGQGYTSRPFSGTHKQRYNNIFLI